MVETVPVSRCDATNMHETVLGVPNADIVACDASYHSKKCCYTRYINLKSIAQTFEKPKQSTAYKETIRQILHEHQDAIVSDNEVFLV